jgi:hypothetical protein
MKGTNRKKVRQRQMTRREFVGGVLGAAGVITGAPALLRGKNLNGKLDIAFIASGGRATDLMDELTITPGRDGRGTTAAGGGARGGAVAAHPVAPHPDENVVVVCDVDENAVDSAAARYPKARTFNDLRRVFDKPNDFDAVVVATCEHTHAFATYLALTHVSVRRKTSPGMAGE